MEDETIYVMNDRQYSYDELKAISQPELDELNDLQGSSHTFGEYLAESLNTGTIETVDDGE